MTPSDPRFPDASASDPSASDPSASDPSASDPSASDRGLLVDLLRGELDATTAEALAERISVDSALAAERDRLVALFALEARRFDVTEAAARADAPRLAASILDRVGRDEAAARRREASSPRRRWARILAGSIALHVVVLGVVVWRLETFKGAAERAEGRVLQAQVVSETFDPLENDYREAVARALSDMEPAELESMPDVVFRFDGSGETLDPALDEMVFGHRKDGQPGSSDRSWAHPRGMGLSLGRRGNEALKRRRLSALGFDASGTLKRVRLGLTYLAGRQRPDGSFAGEDGIDDLEQTAIALLPFLGEGRFSLGDGAASGDTVVERGVEWIRSAVFDEAGAIRPGLDDRAVGVALVALSEDYMLGYGRVGIEQARERRHEIAALGARVRLVVGAASPWPLWAMDAAERTGAVARTTGERERFETWLTTVLPADADDAFAGARIGAAEALAQGTALLRRERGTDKPRFRSWRRTSAGDLQGLLLPNGKAKGRQPGDRIHDTALALLALQVAYRTY